jgi:glycerate kinase
MTNWRDPLRLGTPSPRRLRVLIAVDKFKGSLGSQEVGARIAAGLLWSGIDSDVLALADGGDGSVAAAVSTGYQAVPVVVSGPLGELVDATIAYNGETAVVEIANTCGINLLPEDRLEPLRATTLGFGQAIAHAESLGARRIVLAVGGSASTDGGMGMLAALGARFFDAKGVRLHPSGAALSEVARADLGGMTRLDGIELILASDVTNRLTGASGAARTYGRQKGASPQQIADLNAGLERYVDVLQRSGVRTAQQEASSPTSGSGGGVGFACLLLGATPTSGAEYFLGLTGFRSRVERAHLVVTGEGSLDHQTANGKLVRAVVTASGSRPVVAVVGRNQLREPEWRELGLAEVFSVASQTNKETARNPELTAQLLESLGTALGTRAADLVRDAAGAAAPFPG